MYSSSPLTVFFKYIFPIFMIGGSIFGIFGAFADGTPESIGFAKSMIVATIWISIFLVQFPFRLKQIETSDSGILIKGFSGDKLIDYKDIYWIAKFDLSNPWFVTIKYRDAETGFDKKISYMPNNKYQKMFSGDEMIQHIQDKIELNNPDYSRELAPSKVKNLILLFILSSPFVVLSLYFLFGSIAIL